MNICLYGCLFLRNENKRISRISCVLEDQKFMQVMFISIDLFSRLDTNQTIVICLLLSCLVQINLGSTCIQPLIGHDQRKINRIQFSSYTWLFFPFLLHYKTISLFKLSSQMQTALPFWCAYLLATSWLSKRTILLRWDKHALYVI